MTYLGNSRRNFLKTLTTSTLISTTAVPTFAAVVAEKKVSEPLKSDPTSGSEPDQSKPSLFDGPASSLFEPIPISGNKNIADINTNLVSARMKDAIPSAPMGRGVAWGIPFYIPENVVYLKDKSFQIKTDPFKGPWLLFLHTTDVQQLEEDGNGFYERPFKGIGMLNEHIANYIILYEDGTEQTLPIRQRYQIGMFQQMWGENCVECVAHHKPRPVRFHHEQTNEDWGWTQTKVTADDRGNWINWVWAWENPYPDKRIKGFRFEPLNKMPIILSGITQGNVRTHPLKWNSRQKALLSMPEGTIFDPTLQEHGLLPQIQLDLGQVISAVPRTVYPNSTWEDSYNNKVPEISSKEIIIEYTAHPEARLYLFDKEQVPVVSLAGNIRNQWISPINPAEKMDGLRITVLILFIGEPITVPISLGKR
jgi:hypothetical protein